MLSTKVREKSVGKMRPMRLLAVLLVAAVAFIMGAVAQQVWAQDLEFEEAEIFFELNNTDGDLGIHGLIDGGPWNQVVVSNTAGDLLDVTAIGNLAIQELTEFAFESAEPIFKELPPEEFFARFPEGDYTIHGWSGGEEFSATTEVTQVMPAPADGITLTGSGDPIEVDLNKIDCDKPNKIPVVAGETVTISWDPVTESHPEIGEEGDVEIFNYEFVVETEFELNGVGEEFTAVLSVVLPPGVTSMTIPEEFLALNDEFKYEILAREVSFNQTAVESCFVLE